jgi:hypothetical protein
VHGGLFLDKAPRTLASIHSHTELPHQKIELSSEYATLKQNIAYGFAMKDQILTSMTDF